MRAGDQIDLKDSVFSDPFPEKRQWIIPNFSSHYSSVIWGVRVWSRLLRKRNWMETKRWSKGFLFCDNSHIVKIYFLSLSNTQDNICINIHSDHISIKDEVHISTHEVMFASNRRIKLESFTSHSSSNFALQMNVIFAFLVLSQTLPFEHLWPKSPGLRPLSLGPPGNK